MSQQLSGVPFDRSNDYAQHDLVAKYGVLYRIQICKTNRYQLVRLCKMCARVGRARGAARGSDYCARCSGTCRKPEQRGDKKALGYYAVRGGYQVQVRVKGVQKRKWVKTEPQAKLLAHQWRGEKAEANSKDGACEG